jgi:predicted metal-dependent phosphoesterase TrpH
MPGYDLHTHSTASDGAYAPAELVRQAAQAGLAGLALTDHDSTAGVAEAQAAAAAAGIRLFPAAEISATWQGRTVHIVGLNLDPGSPQLQEGLARLQTVRDQRAREIGRRLDRHGIPGVFEAVAAAAGSGMITRTHFARHLAGLRLAGSAGDAFNRYLCRGKPGYVPTVWVAMDEAIAWIRTAGGVAVLAHPLRYKLTGSWLRRLLAEFREAGGEGIEVASGTAAPGEVQASAELARRFGLLASAGSDFHSPDHPWPKLGRLPPLPTGVEPVWNQWR